MAGSTRMKAKPRARAAQARPGWAARVPLRYKTMPVALAALAVAWTDSPVVAVVLAIGYGAVLWRTWPAKPMRERTKPEGPFRPARSTAARQLQVLESQAAKIMGGAPYVKIEGSTVRVYGWPDETDDTPDSKVWDRLADAVSTNLGRPYLISRRDPLRNSATLKPVPELPTMVAYFHAPKRSES